MGRANPFRQKLIGHVESVADKRAYSWVLQQTRDRFGVAQDGAEQLAQKAFRLVSRNWVVGWPITVHESSIQYDLRFQIR